MTRRTTHNMPRLRTLDDVRRQQERLRIELTAQEQRIRIDVNNVRAAWSGVTALNRRMQCAIDSIRPWLGYVSLGVGVAQLVLKLRKSRRHA